MRDRSRQQQPAIGLFFKNPPVHFLRGEWARQHHKYLEGHCHFNSVFLAFQAFLVDEGNWYQCCHLKK